MFYNTVNEKMVKSKCPLRCVLLGKVSVKRGLYQVSNDEKMLSFSHGTTSVNRRTKRKEIVKQSFTDISIYLWFCIFP